MSRAAPFSLRWFSFYQIGVLFERLGLTPGEVSRAYLEAWQYRPMRAEPLCQLARYHRERREFALGYLKTENPG